MIPLRKERTLHLICERPFTGNLILEQTQRALLPSLFIRQTNPVLILLSLKGYPIKEILFMTPEE
jgi:hypothetical protein